MENATLSASGNYARLIAANVSLFNNTPPEDNMQSGNVRMKTLRNLFSLSVLEDIAIFGLANYKPRNSFKEEVDSKCWYARVAIDRKNKCESFVAIEERCDNRWVLKKLIPLKNITSIKTSVMGTDATRFYLNITASDLLDIETPSFITF